VIWVASSISDSDDKVLHAPTVSPSCDRVQAAMEQMRDNVVSEDLTSPPLLLLRDSMNETWDGEAESRYSLSPRTRDTR